MSGVTDLYLWGSGLHGELGNSASKIEPGAQAHSRITPTLLCDLQGKQVVKVELGDCRTVVLTSQGEVYQWGRRFGRSIDDNDRYRPKMVLWSDVSWTPTRIELPQRVANVFCGYSHCFLLTTSNELWALGSNKFGQLGIRDQSSASEPRKVAFPDTAGIKGFCSISVGKHHSAAVTYRDDPQNTTVYAWGRGGAGQLGVGMAVNVMSPVPIDELKDKHCTQVACGLSHTGFLGRTGTVYVCGMLSESCLIWKPRKITCLSSLETGGDVKQISAGEGFLALLDSTGRAYIWPSSSQLDDQTLPFVPPRPLDPNHASTAEQKGSENQETRQAVVEVLYTGPQKVAVHTAASDVIVFDVGSQRDGHPVVRHLMNSQGFNPDAEPLQLSPGRYGASSAAGSSNSPAPPSRGVSGASTAGSDMSFHAPLGLTAWDKALDLPNAEDTLRAPRVKQVALGVSHSALLVYWEPGSDFSSLCPVKTARRQALSATQLDNVFADTMLVVGPRGHGLQKRFLCHRLFLHCRLGNFRLANVPQCVNVFGLKDKWQSHDGFSYSPERGTYMEDLKPLSKDSRPSSACSLSNDDMSTLPLDAESELDDEWEQVHLPSGGPRVDGELLLAILPYLLEWTYTDSIREIDIATARKLLQFATQWEVTKLAQTLKINMDDHVHGGTELLGPRIESLAPCQSGSETARKSTDSVGSRSEAKDRSPKIQDISRRLSRHNGCTLQLQPSESTKLMESMAQGTLLQGDLAAAVDNHDAELYGCDVAFDVGGQTIYAHKSVLACRSMYFRGMFRTGPFGWSLAESRHQRVEPIALPGIQDSQTFRLCLEWLYCASIKDDVCQDVEQLAYLLMLADLFALPDLKHRCETLLFQQIHSVLTSEGANNRKRRRHRRTHSRPLRPFSGSLRSSPVCSPARSPATSPKSGPRVPSHHPSQSMSSAPLHSPAPSAGGSDLSSGSTQDGHQPPIPAPPPAAMIPDRALFQSRRRSSKRTSLIRQRSEELPESQHFAALRPSVTMDSLELTKHTHAPTPAPGSPSTKAHIRRRDSRVHPTSQTPLEVPTSSGLVYSASADTLELDRAGITSNSLQHSPSTEFVVLPHRQATSKQPDRDKALTARHTVFDWLMFANKYNAPRLKELIRTILPHLPHEVGDESLDLAETPWTRDTWREVVHHRVARSVHDRTMDPLEAEDRVVMREDFDRMERPYRFVLGLSITRSLCFFAASVMLIQKYSGDEADGDVSWTAITGLVSLTLLLAMLIRWAHFTHHQKYSIDWWRSRQFRKKQEMLERNQEALEHLQGALEHLSSGQPSAVEQTRDRLAGRLSMLGYRGQSLLLSPLPTLLDSDPGVDEQSSELVASSSATVPMTILDIPTPEPMSGGVVLRQSTAPKSHPFEVPPGARKSNTSDQDPESPRSVGQDTPKGYNLVAASDQPGQPDIELGSVVAPARLSLVIDEHSVTQFEVKVSEIVETGTPRQLASQCSPSGDRQHCFAHQHIPAAVETALDQAGTVTRTSPSADASGDVDRLAMSSSLNELPTSAAGSHSTVDEELGELVAVEKEQVGAELELTKLRAGELQGYVSRTDVVYLCLAIGVCTALIAFTVQVGVQLESDNSIRWGRLWVSVILFDVAAVVVLLYHGCLYAHRSVYVIRQRYPTPCSRVPRYGLLLFQCVFKMGLSPYGLFVIQTCMLWAKTTDTAPLADGPWWQTFLPLLLVMGVIVGALAIFDMSLIMALLLSVVPALRRYFASLLQQFLTQNPNWPLVIGTGVIFHFLAFPLFLALLFFVLTLDEIITLSSWSIGIPFLLFQVSYGLSIFWMYKLRNFAWVKFYHVWRR